MTLTTWSEAVTGQSGYSNTITYRGNINWHKTSVAPAAVEDQNKEQDMALRQSFTFPYTGTEIADALSHRIQELTDQITALHSLDSTALELIYDLERDTDLSWKVERQVKALQGRVEVLVKERVPYVKAGKQSFDLDLDDVKHFGLNNEDVPVKQRRTRKPRSTEPVDEVDVAQ